MQNFFMQGTVPQLQCHSRLKEAHTSPVFFGLWWHTASFLWIFHQQDHHNTKQPSSNETNSDYEQNRLLQSLNNLFRKFSKSLSPNHAILIPFPQNWCTKTLMLSALQPPTSSLYCLLVLYHQTSKLLLSNPCSKQKTKTKQKQKQKQKSFIDQNMLKTYRHLPFFCLTFSKR